MLDLPELVAYERAGQHQLLGQPLLEVRLAKPEVFPPASRPIDVLLGRLVTEVRRIGLKLALGFEGNYSCLFEFGPGSRLDWSNPGSRLSPRLGLLALDFPQGVLELREIPSPKIRSRCRLVSGAELAKIRNSGLDPLSVGPADWLSNLRRHSGPIYSVLTDPACIDQLGPGFAAELLQRAGIFPGESISVLTDEQILRIHHGLWQILQQGLPSTDESPFPGWPSIRNYLQSPWSAPWQPRLSCPACGTSLQRLGRDTSAARYCPVCQPPAGGASAKPQG